jgi:hypothetical protein
MPEDLMGWQFSRHEPDALSQGNRRSEQISDGCLRIEGDLSLGIAFPFTRPLRPRQGITRAFDL